MINIGFKRYITLPYRLMKALYYKASMAGYGWHSIINAPLKIDGMKDIVIGNHVVIEYKTWLAAVPLTGDSSVLEIQDGTKIGHFNHIFATHSIIIEKNVLTADKVYISDNQHGYKDINLPIIVQPIKQKGCVRIGEGSWLGENVCVIGASIGKHCVIGANSVVTHDIPDFSVAVGSPARVIKRYDMINRRWTYVNNYGKE